MSVALVKQLGANLKPVRAGTPELAQPQALR